MRGMREPHLLYVCVIPSFLASSPVRRTCVSLGAEKEISSALMAGAGAACSLKRE